MDPDASDSIKADEGTKARGGGDEGGLFERDETNRRRMSARLSPPRSVRDQEQLQSSVGSRTKHRGPYAQARRRSIVA